MLKKVLLIALVLVFALAFGAVNAFADDGGEKTCPAVYNADEDLWVTGYCDGRLNAFDIAQPVAIYYSYDSVEAWDDDGSPYWTDVVSGIQLWAIDSESSGQLVMWVPVAQLDQALASTTNVQIAASGGFTLNYSPSLNSFWVTTPDGYTFTWEAW